MLKTLSFTLCLTHDCTLRCRYCYAGRKWRHAMAPETAFRGIELALAEAKRQGSALDLGFFGGEPLMEWELLQACDAYLRERAGELPAPPRFTLTTNGTLLDEGKLAWLAERDYLLGLSVDGSAAMHDLNRVHEDGHGSYAELLPVFAWLAQHPELRRTIICVVTPNNCHLLAEGVRSLAQTGEHPIDLNFDYWSAWSDERFAVLESQLRLCAQQMTESYRAGHPLRLGNLRNKIITHLKGGYQPCDRCGMAEREICLSVDGNFFPCSRLVSDGDNPAVTFGNVREGINRARQEWLMAQHRNTHAACLTCALRCRCMNSCGSTNFASTGSFSKVAPITCALEQLQIELADGVAETLYAEQNPAFLCEFYGAS